MRTRLSATVGLLGLVLVVAGCVSLKRTPEARFFVLQPLAEAGPSAGEALVGVVGVETVRLPDHLARPQIVTWIAPNELQIDEFLRWGEPLEEGFTRTLGEDLAALLPDHEIVLRPWPGDTATRCRVLVTVSDFGLQRDGRVRLEGRWALLPDHGGLALLQQAVNLERGPLAITSAEASMPNGVELMSELVADLSRQVADAIRALPPEEPAAREAGDETGSAESPGR